MCLKVAWARMSLNLRCVVQHAGLKLECSHSDYRMLDPKKQIVLHKSSRQTRGDSIVSAFVFSVYCIYYDSVM